MVFDSNLYYQEGIYRTPTMMEVLSCNYLIMRGKLLLVYEKKGVICQSPPPVESERIELSSKQAIEELSTRLVSD